jgi:hypothetical protein
MEENKLIQDNFPLDGVGDRIIAASLFIDLATDAILTHPDMADMQDDRGLRITQHHVTELQKCKARLLWVMNNYALEVKSRE